MVFTFFERFRKGYGNGLASDRGGVGTEVLRSDRLMGPDFPIICPYLPPSGIFFGLASPLLMPLKALPPSPINFLRRLPGARAHRHPPSQLGRVGGVQHDSASLEPRSLQLFSSPHAAFADQEPSCGALQR